jgi:hypothetical protein
MLLSSRCKVKKDLNKWNKLRYSVHSLYYDRLVGSLEKGRKHAIEVLAPGDYDRILIIGAGTGLDLKYLKKTQEITAIGITPAMITRLKTLIRNFSSISLQWLWMDINWNLKITVLIV